MDEAVGSAAALVIDVILGRNVLVAARGPAGTSIRLSSHSAGLPRLRA